MANENTDEAEQSIAVYEKLYQSIPSIGFLSRKKRVMAYLTVTQLAQGLIDAGELSEDNAQYVLSLLVRKHASFQKAAMMAALHLAAIDRQSIVPVGFKYANTIRCNMKLLPID
jgi:hypothetical protein